MKLSIIVPCFNESDNIPIILEKFSDVISRNDIEVVLVNNGSTDNTKDTLKRLLPKYNFARSVEVKTNKGYGFGIISGLQKARGEFIGYTHADMQTHPADPIKALEIIEKYQDPQNYFIKGDRKGRPFLDQFFTLGMSLFESILLGTKLWDINAQPNIFHKDFFESIKDDCPEDFSFDLYLLYMAKLNGLKIKRFNVIFPQRAYGKSSWNTGLASKWKFIKRTLEFSFSLKKKL
jgi:glycosyltransferase involved in cell wall biosynthesis